MERGGQNYALGLKSAEFGANRCKSDSSSGLGRASRILCAVTLIMSCGVKVSFAADRAKRSAADLTEPQGSRQPSGLKLKWLENLKVSGFLQETLGAWQNPSGLRDLTPSRNSLATARSLLQVDENLTIGENNRIFAREWFVYEPPYDFNSRNNERYSELSLSAGHPASFGHFMNGFYNQFTLRDVWWESTWGPLDLYVGNQIVEWGQSIAFRVGDVVNPQDTTWALGFANLEQSHVPQWMLHPILNLPDAGPLNSNFLEAVVMPRYQPQWNYNYADGRYYDEDGVAGSVNQGFPAAMHSPSARFDVHYVDAYYPGRTALAPQPPFSLLGPFGPEGRGLIAPPFSRELYWCSSMGGVPLPPQPLNPIPATRKRACEALSNGTVNFGPLSGGLFDVGQWKIPAATISNWEEGIRLHTLIGNSELTAFYFNTFDYNPSFEWQRFTNQWRAKFMPVQYVGVTGDQPLPLPGLLAEQLPLVGRAELVYANHQPFVDFNPLNLSGVRFSDTVDMMVALDLDQAYAPWLTATGSLSANIEVQDYITMDANQSMAGGVSPFGGAAADLTETVNKNEVNALLNVGTSWWWDSVVPEWTMIFNPKGRTFLLFPSLTLTPPWTHKYFLKLQAIEILSGDKQSLGGGVFKGESLLTAQLQYNFSLD